MKNYHNIPEYIDLSEWEKSEIDQYFLPESGLMIVDGPELELSHLQLDEIV